MSRAFTKKAHKAFQIGLRPMSLTSKIAGLAVALVVAATVAFGFLMQRAAETAITNREGDRLIYGVTAVAQKLNEEIETAISDLDVTASTATVKGLVRSIENGGIDPVDGIATAQWKRRLSDYLVAILSTQKSYLSVDLIGIADNGRQILRIERSKDGEIRPAANAPTLRDAAFFQNTLAQPIGTPYIADITPAGRGGSPVIEIGRTVLTEDGKKFAVLKITLNCARLIARLNSFSDSVSKLYMTTLDGHYIVNPDAKPSATVGAKHSARIQDDYPWLAPAFASSAAAKAKDTEQRLAPRPAAAVYPEGKSYKDEGHVARTLCVTAGAGAFKRTWVILGVIDTHVLVDSLLTFQRYLAGIVLALIALSLIIASILARRITRPISRLTEAAKLQAQGKLDATVRLEKSDDQTVAELAKAFIAMQRAVKSRERRLNDARARIEAIVNSATSAIITVDTHGTIMQANHATGHLFGYDPSALSGQKLSTLTQDSYVDSLFGPSADGEIIGKPREILAKRADGKTFPAEISINRVQISGAERSFVVMLTDLSERKRYEDLDNQLKLERIKGEFVSTVSHELRTPLTSINGSLALLKSERIGTMPPNAKPLINIAYSNGERLMRLINDILDMETIKSGTLRFVFEELDVGMLVYEAARANAAYAEQLDVKIKVARIPQGIVIMADPDRIAQALANLISNAAKFSPKGGTIDLSVKRTNGWVRICVTDKGEGIPVGFRDRVFSRFAQADSTDARQKGGSGLGLSITKAIAEAHSGKVGFKTAVGKGTTFFIDLPIMAPAAAHTEPQQDTASAPPPGQSQPSLRGL
jgi:PAS domain S-box-containing protein